MHSKQRKGNSFRPMVSKNAKGNSLKPMVSRSQKGNSLRSMVSRSPKGNSLRPMVSKNPKRNSFSSKISMTPLMTYLSVKGEFLQLHALQKSTFDPPLLKDGGLTLEVKGHGVPQRLLGVSHGVLQVQPGRPELGPV